MNSRHRERRGRTRPHPNRCHRDPGADQAVPARRDRPGRAHDRLRARDHGADRRERRRQNHPDQDSAGPGLADQRPASALGRDTAVGAERIRTLTGYMPEHDCRPPTSPAPSSSPTWAGCPGCRPRRPGSGPPNPWLRRPARRAVPAHRHLFDRDEAAGEAVKTLVGDPRLLLLDEPTTGLDPGGRAAMLELIARIGGQFGISIVVSSHLLGGVERICDHVVALERGGPPRANTMTSFTRLSQVLAVEVEEGRQELAAALTRRGLASRPDGGLAGRARRRPHLRRAPGRHRAFGAAAQPPRTAAAAG